MRKNFLILFFSIFSFLGSFSQMSTKGVRRQMDSLQKILPSLKDTSRIICLNRLAYLYNWVPWASWKTMDSSNIYAKEANAEAIRINYRRGMARSFVILGNNETVRIDSYLDRNYKVDSNLLRSMVDSCEQFLRQAISLGEEMQSNDILGEAYWYRNSLIISKNNWDVKNEKELNDEEDFLKKSISYYEKTSDELSLACVYRDLYYVYLTKNNFKLVEEYVQKSLQHYQKAGDDRMLGDFYCYNLYNLPSHKKDLNVQAEDLKNAIYYYEKVEEITPLARAYSMLAGIYRRKIDLPSSEEILKNGIAFFQKIGSEAGENSVCAALSGQYFMSGEFEKAIPYCERSIQLTEKLTNGPPTRDKMDWGSSFFWMARFYKMAGDYETALHWIRRCRSWYATDSIALGNWNAEIGDIHRLNGNLDSAMGYLKIFESNTRLNYSGYGKMNLAELYVTLKQFDKALPLAKESLELSSRLDKSGTGPNHTILAKVYFGLGDYQSALKDARLGTFYLKKSIHQPRMMENCLVLSSIFEKIGRIDSAYYYLKQYASMKDSLLSRQFYWRLNNYKKQSEEERKTSQINLLNKDNQLKKQELKQEATLKKGLIAIVILLLFLGVFVFRDLIRKRKNDLLKQKLENEKKQAELEMQALRAQMNPHFIFNCLSSINLLILKNESKTASNYLTRFSRLMRMVLMNSQRTLISLDDELEMLELYLEMERMRFKNAFDYKISFLNVVDRDNIFIPPLILQPFCENAIWHGLMHKEGPGLLDIEFSLADKILSCTITDNGVGREMAERMKSKTAEKQKSMGLKITNERLTLLNKKNGIHTSYEMEDLKDENGTTMGTKVTLSLCITEPLPETV